MATQREFTAEDVQKKLQQLPPQVKSLMYSDDLTLGIQKVGEKNRLHYDQMGTLELETKNVMLGFTETADFSDILMQSLSVPKEQADTIASDVNNELFVKIRDAMKSAATPATVVEKLSNPPAISAASTVAHATEAKSVVMPSAVKAPVPTATVATPPAPPVTKPASFPQMPHIDAMLSAPTVSIAPKLDAAPAAPAIALGSVAKPAPVDVTKSDAPKPPPIYKTDPYHEPVE